MYILHKSIQCYDSTSCEIIGIFENLKDAEISAIKNALFNMNENIYDPSKRFRTCTSILGEKYWADSWSYLIGIDTYIIEEWSLDSNKCLQKLYFNFDYYMKKYISDKKLSKQQVNDLLDEWKKTLPVFPDCFSNKKQDTFPEIDRELWYIK